MNQPANVDAWEEVDSLPSFVAYLHLLSAEAAARRWRNATIPDFLTAIATLLVITQENIALGNPAFAEPMMTDWWEVACLLSAARDEAPAPLPDGLDIAGDATAVDGLDSLLGYVRWLIEDFLLDQAEVAERTLINKWANSGRWAHGILPNWLAAWAAWLEDAYLKPLPVLMVKHGITREPIEPVSWRSIAIQLSGARIYE